MEAVISLAKQKANVIVSDGVDLAAKGFELREGETEEEAAKRLLMAFVAELRS